MPFSKYVSKIFNKIIENDFFSLLMSNYPKIRNPLYLKHYIGKIRKYQKSNLIELTDFALIGKNLIDLRPNMTFSTQLKVGIKEKC